jgi:hypothetical protein
MGKIILEFDNIEERDDAVCAINGIRWKSTLWELDQHYRSIAKHSDHTLEIEEAERVRQKIREILFDNELIL